MDVSSVEEEENGYDGDEEAEWKGKTRENGEAQDMKKQQRKKKTASQESMEKRVNQFWKEEE